MQGFLGLKVGGGGGLNLQIWELRWLDTVFKKLSYSLLNTLNFRTVKFR